MGILYREAARLIGPYGRKGGKSNRKKQCRRMLEFIDHLEKHELKVKEWRHIGRRHVIRYYKRHRSLSPRTIEQHYYAIRRLFEILEIPHEVPVPDYSLHGLD